MWRKMWVHRRSGKVVNVPDSHWDTLPFAVKDVDAFRNGYFKEVYNAGWVRAAWGGSVLMYFSSTAKLSHQDLTNMVFDIHRGKARGTWTVKVERDSPDPNRGVLTTDTVQITLGESATRVPVRTIYYSKAEAGQQLPRAMSHYIEDEMDKTRSQSMKRMIARRLTGEAPDDIVREAVEDAINNVVHEEEQQPKNRRVVKEDRRLRRRHSRRSSKQELRRYME